VECSEACKTTNGLERVIRESANEK